MRTLTACSLSTLAWIDVLHSDIREASNVTINTSYFHPAHQHYIGEVQKAEYILYVYDKLKMF